MSNVEISLKVLKVFLTLGINYVEGSELFKYEVRQQWSIPFKEFTGLKLLCTVTYEGTHMYRIYDEELNSLDLLEIKELYDTIRREFGIDE